MDVLFVDFIYASRLLIFVDLFEEIMNIKAESFLIGEDICE